VGGAREGGCDWDALEGTLRLGKSTGRAIWKVSD
jgi:hypothetical protein